MRILTLTALLLHLLPLQAQPPMRGEVDYPGLGISFRVPEGWEAQEGDGVIFFGSPTVKGLILMSIQELANEADLARSLEAGFSEDGITLFAEGEARIVRKGMARISYAGKVENEAAKGLGIALLNPHGDGLSLVALALEKVYGPQLEQALDSLAGSIVFRSVPPAEGPGIEHWTKHLTQVRLTRIMPVPPDSTNGSARAEPEWMRIDLCAGWFSIARSGQAVDPGKTPQEGSWQVLAGPRGKVILRLDHANGHRSEYHLDEQQGKIYLNGQRWFRTLSGEHSPDCDHPPGSR
jgi:hypothetical protein